jgi:hypothetical protein
MATSEIYSLLHIINFQCLEVNGIMHTHTHTHTTTAHAREITIFQENTIPVLSLKKIWQVFLRLQPLPLPPPHMGRGTRSVKSLIYPVILCAVVIPRLTRDSLKNAEHLIRGLRVKLAMTGIEVN